MNVVITILTIKINGCEKMFPLLTNIKKRDDNLNTVEIRVPGSFIIMDREILKTVLTKLWFNPLHRHFLKNAARIKFLPSQILEKIKHFELTDKNKIEKILGLLKSIVSDTTLRKVRQILSKRDELFFAETIEKDLIEAAWNEIHRKVE